MLWSVERGNPFRRRDQDTDIGKYVERFKYFFKQKERQIDKKYVRAYLNQTPIKQNKFIVGLTE